MNLNHFGHVVQFIYAGNNLKCLLLFYLLFDADFKVEKSWEVYYTEIMKIAKQVEPLWKQKKLSRSFMSIMLQWN